MILVIYFFMSCFKLENPLPPLDNNAIFSSSSLIETVAPANNDTVSATPAFAWVATGRKLVYLGIFVANIDIKDNKIVNIKDNIWAWHSGLGKGREGFVSFADGVDVVNGNLQVDRIPTPLIFDRAYIWAVWAWDDAGKKVVSSSQELFFVVTPRIKITIKSIKVVNTCDPFSEAGEFYYQFKIVYNNKEQIIAERTRSNFISARAGETILIDQSIIVLMNQEPISQIDIKGTVIENDTPDGIGDNIVGEFCDQYSYLINQWSPGDKEKLLEQNSQCGVFVYYNLSFVR